MADFLLLFIVNISVWSLPFAWSQTKTAGSSWGRITGNL